MTLSSLGGLSSIAFLLARPSDGREIDETLVDLGQTSQEMRLVAKPTDRLDWTVGVF